MPHSEDETEFAADAVTEHASEDSSGPMLRKREIVAHVAQETGQSKSDVRRTLDSALAYMRQGLLDGMEVHYPALGKVRIKAPNREGAKPLYRVALAKEAAVQDGEADEG